MNPVRHARWLVTLLVFGLAPLSAEAARSVSLERWTETELIPYLVEQLGKHPRFSGEPVMLVALRDGEVLARIDGLTEQLRARMFEALLDKPGIVVAWRPEAAIPGRASETLPCLTTPVVAYYIGIEVQAESSGNARVSVRALDLGERSWVSGFGQEWSGRLERGERAALARNADDSALRGLRNLPFDPVQTDLAAAFLAQRLACSLARGVSAGTTISVAGNIEPKLLPLAQLVVRYLGRSAGLRIATGGDSADLILRASEHAIADGLVQWWMSLEPAPGAAEEIQTYSAMAYARQFAVARSVPEQSVYAATVATERPPLPTHETVRYTPVREPLHARISVMHSALPGCADDPDWLRGARRMDVLASIVPGDCFEIRPAPSPAVGHFWLIQRADGSLVRADPAPDCLRAGRRVPQRWAGGEGFESHFLIAARDTNAAGRLRRHIDALPGACSSRGGLHGGALNQWRQELARLLNSLGARAVWQGVKLRHSDQALQAGR